MSVSGKGTLYVVATPIGNLDDLSPRAAAILAGADLIAAEDTRHSGRLLAHIGARVALISLHEHNESSRIARICHELDQGHQVALVSDAGTPLISDPGYRLIRALREGGYRVVPVPGPSALVTALCAAGLPTERFLFEGFLPAKGSARRQRLQALAHQQVTLVCYESPHRIVALLTDIDAVFAERQVVLARELTKTFETFLHGSGAALLAQLEDDPDQQRGEFVVMIAPAEPIDRGDARTVEGDALLSALLSEAVGVKQCAAVVARLLGGRKRDWYERAMALRDSTG
ncbi:16S rRNA (cytidine(1402)-2'-O)-methyltransferase [Kushneria aurantia]|uniref:Ribosomal RNA small subunit methyltransferase I n=1 Tax=Kushneria aurantia TaxID=504092 RepID=A0ABV6G030_9GAMM|nr:16S rRNA (cytidine(1402)-2'-O)-methyltransferase [Kushneria aurantia]